MSKTLIRLIFLPLTVIAWEYSCIAQDSASAVYERIVEANTKFGFKLFSKLIGKDDKKNVFISPASISFALAMTYNGAKGSTQQVIGRTLGLEGINIQEVNTSYRSMLSALNNPDSPVQLMIANSLWANKDFRFYADFLERTKTYYHAEVENLDFADSASPSKINRWVNEKTRGKIHGIVDRIDEDAILYLLNAIYFKGNWSNKFDEKLTEEKDFNLTDGRKKKVRMMTQGGRYQYLRGNNFQAVSLPYGSGRISMYIFLPDSGIGLKGFYQYSLSSSNWETWMSEIRSMQGSIHLPRFRMENDFILNEPLKSIGMDEAFSKGKANFHAMCELRSDQNAYISEVKHKTFVEVNEEGSEAAAVTSVQIQVETAGIGAVEPRFDMIVDRPFFCAIRDNKTGMLLFLGSIEEP